MTAADGPGALVRRHYATLLGRVYSWTLGDFDARLAAEEAAFAQLGLRGPGAAIDLGCGSGLHALALARLGYRVTGVDSDAGLLAELRRRAAGRDVATAQADFVEHLEACAPADLIVCMGDGLSHLPERAQLDVLFRRAHRALRPGGRLVLSFRDQTVALHGAERFFVVRADRDRVLTVFLEYFDAHLLVHDLLHERAGDGVWRLHAGAYPKLRLRAADVAPLVAGAGFRVERSDAENRVVRLVASRGDGQ